MKEKIKHTKVFDIDGTLVVANDFIEACNIYREKYSCSEIQRIENISFGKECIIKVEL